MGETPVDPKVLAELERSVAAVGNLFAGLLQEYRRCVIENRLDDWLKALRSITVLLEQDPLRKGEDDHG